LQANDKTIKFLHQLVEGAKEMMDSLSQTYAELLDGVYDCPDRIVLNAYFRAGHIPGGFRLWWRDLHGSDENLDNEHLMRMAGRFSRRIRAYGQKHGIPVIDCKKGIRKHQIAQEYLPQNPEFKGLFLVLVARASAPAWHVQKTKDGRIQNLARKYPYVNHYHFHIMDPEWGHVTIRMSGHPPFGAQVILNGHEYVSCLAAQQGRHFPKEGNCFTDIIGQADGCRQADASRCENAIGPLAIEGDLPNLTQMTDTLCSESMIGSLRQVCDRWLYTCLHFGLPSEEQKKTRFRYDYSVFQVEYSRNFLFQRGCQLEQCFQGLIDRTRTHLDIKRLKTIFGMKRRPFWPQDKIKQPPREEIVIERPAHDLTIFKIHFGKLTVKLYSKGARVLRCEAIVHNTKALKGKRSLSAFPHIVNKLKQILIRFLNQLQTIDTPFIANDTLDVLPTPTKVGKSRVAGIDLNKPRVRAVLEAVVALAVGPTGFSVSDLAVKVREILGVSPTDYLPRHASYDLKKLRGQQWVKKIGKSRRYETVPEGLQIMTALMVLREKVIKPVLAGAGKPKRGPHLKQETDIDKQYRLIHGEMRSLFHLLGVVV
jgi:hypothetical protein